MPACWPAGFLAAARAPVARGRSARTNYFITHGLKW